jgi:ribosomal protein L11 methyltransferase
MPEAVEAVSEAMNRFAPGGVAIEEPYSLADDGQEAVPIPDAPVTVRVYVPAGERGAEARAGIEEALWHIRQIGFGEISGASERAIAEEDWANAWKEHFHVLHLGRRTVIKPTWRDYTAQPGEIVVELDPGMAFGTGLHPTTRGCILALEDALREGDRVLDVGTGSGILGLAALKLGAASVRALDVSPEAVDAARANAAANGVAGRMTVEMATLEGAIDGGHFPLPPGVATLGAETGEYDVVLANIIARVIMQIAPALVRATRPGGVLIASGIINERRAETEEALRAAGMPEMEAIVDGDWVTLAGRRPS